MPDEYISRAEALEITTRTCGDYAAAFAAIRKLPAADVAEVVHGQWLEEKKQTLLPVEYDDVGKPILHDYVVYRCDRCGRTCKQKEPYCHCGAKMDGDKVGDHADD